MSGQLFVLLGLIAFLTRLVSCLPSSAPSHLAVRGDATNSINTTGSNPLATSFDGNIRIGATLFLDAHPDALLVGIFATNSPDTGGRRPLVDKPEDLLEIRENFIIEEPGTTWAIRSNPYATYGSWYRGERTRQGFEGQAYFSMRNLKYTIKDALSIAQDAGVSGQISQIIIVPFGGMELVARAPQYNIFFSNERVVIDATNGQIVEISPISNIADMVNAETTGTGPLTAYSSVAIA